MERVCVTRALKNARQLERLVPEAFAGAPPRPYSTVLGPLRLLNRLEQLLDLPGAPVPEPLHRYRARLHLSRPGARAAAPLFRGTIHFVATTFASPGGRSSVAPADLEVARSYAAAALGAIVRYAGQYGPAAAQIAGGVVPFSASVGTGGYSDRDLQGWVDEIARTSSIPAEDALVFLNPPGVQNSDAPVDQGVLGYHGFASRAYSFVNLLGSGLVLGDPGDQFALALSHELAEMVVDPRADGSNPEVCDPCGPNCQTAFRDYFSASGAYQGTTSAFPPAYPYAFFVNAIVQPAGATACPAPVATCEYAPP